MSPKKPTSMGSALRKARSRAKDPDQDKNSKSRYNTYLLKKRLQDQNFDEEYKRKEKKRKKKLQTLHQVIQIHQYPQRLVVRLPFTSSNKSNPGNSSLESPMNFSFSELDSSQDMNCVSPSDLNSNFSPSVSESRQAKTGKHFRKQNNKAKILRQTALNLYLLTLTKKVMQKILRSETHQRNAQFENRK